MTPLVVSPYLQGFSPWFWLVVEPLKAASWISEIAKSVSGNILVQFPSQKGVVEAEDVLTEFCSSYNIHLVSHRSGGKGKIQSFLQKEGRKIFCGTQALFAKVLPVEGVTFSVFFFQRFFFPPPGNSLDAVRKKSLADPFKELALAHSLAKFEQAYFLAI